MRLFRAFWCAAIIAAIAHAPLLSGAGRTCEDLSSLALPQTTITAAKPVAAGAFVPPGDGGRGAEAMKDLPAFCRVAATLDADQRFRHQGRSVAAGLRLERQVPGGRQRRVGGFDRLCSDGRRARARLRDQLAPTPGTAGRRRELRAGTSREANRLRLARRARDDGESEGDDRRALRRGAEALVLERLLGRRQAGAQGGAALPGGLRRHRRRRARRRLDGPRVAAMRVAATVHEDEASNIPPAKYPAIHAAVLEACDALDGVKDGVLENPRAAGSIRRSLAVQGRRWPACLTPRAGETRAAIYAPVEESARPARAISRARARQRTRLGDLARRAAARHRLGPLSSTSSSRIRRGISTGSTSATDIAPR